MDEETNMADALDVIEAAKQEYDSLSDAIKHSAPFTATDKDGNLVQLDDGKKPRQDVGFKDKQGNSYQLSNNRGQIRVTKTNL